MKNILLFLILFSITTGAFAENRARTINSVELSDAAAWVGAVPGASDVALWTAGSRTGSGVNNQLNSNAAWQGIATDTGFDNNSVTLNGTGELTLGSAGITLLGGTSGNFTTTLSKVILSTDQTWTSNSGRQLVMTPSTLDIGNTARTISIGNSDAASTSNKITLSNVSGGVNASLRLTNANANPATSPVWVLLTSGGVQRDLTIGNGVLVYGASSTLASTINLTVEAGGVLDVSQKSSSATTQTVTSLSGAGTITSGRTTASGNTTLIVNGGSGVSSTFSGNIVNGSTNGVSLTKQGDSTLILSGSNTTSGVFTVSGGILRLDSAGAFSTNGNLLIDGGVVELGTGNSTFTKVLTGDPNGVKISGNGGGFGAVGADATVNLGASVQWGSGNFFTTGAGAFVLSSETSTHKVTFSSADFNLSTGNSGGMTRTIEVRNGAAAVDAEISGVMRNNNINAPASIIKTGKGTLSLTGANVYTGTTTVSDGTLLVDNTTGSGTGTGAVSVASGATLGGIGIISGATAVDGILSPGSNGIGELTIHNHVTWNYNNAWVWELDTAGIDMANYGVSDSLAIDGDFLKGTGTAFTFDFAHTGEIGWYRLIDWTGTTGFAETDFLVTNLANGLIGTFEMHSGALYLNLDVIPEPSSFLLVGIGLTAFLFRRKRG